MRRFSLAAALVAAAVTAACEPPDADAGDSGDSVQPIPATIAAHEPRARLTEELRLDANAEDFSVVSTVAVGPEGRMAVRLGQDQEVRIYDAGGVLLGRIGKQGQGPGEFERMGTVGWLADTLYVTETHRITYADAAGALLRVERVPYPMELIRDGGPPIPLLRTTPSAALGNGTLLVSAWSTDPSLESPFDVRFDPATGFARLATNGFGGGSDDPRWSIRVDGLGQVVPFALRPIGGFAPDFSRLARLYGELTSDAGGEVVLQVVSTMGDTLYSRRYPFVGEKVTDAERDSVLAALLKAPTEDGATSRNREFHAQAKERMWPVHAPVASVRLGQDGTVWLVLRRTPEGQPVLVLDPAGNPIGSVVLPPRTTIQAATSTRLWVIERDELGLTSVVRYRIEGLRWR